MPPSALPIAIYYEQPNWFKPLFAELDRRGASYVKLHAPDHTFAPEQHPEQEYALVFNRMSPSAWNRDHGDQIFYTLSFLDHLERRGVRVINGLKAFRTELSKAAQLSLLEDLGLPYPKARVIHRAAQATSVTDGLRWPVVVKPNIGGSGAGIMRFDHAEQLAAPLRSRRRTGRTRLGIDHVALVQEFIPARDGAHRARRGVGRPLSLRHQRLHRPANPSISARPTSASTTTASSSTRAACAVDAPKTGLRVEGLRHRRAKIIADVERIMQRAGIDIGGVEYIDRRPRRPAPTTTTSTRSRTSSPTAST